MYSKLSVKAQNIEGANIYNIKKKGNGNITYALSKATIGKKSVKSSFTVDKKTGKLTIKRGLKKGTYNVELKVSAAGDKSHNKATRKVTITVKVK